jgi:2,4-dienoyl-CoA reductase-like NADH-dependent reductase (Old Yellow Enzyme family)
LVHPLDPFSFGNGRPTLRNRTVLAAMTNKQSHADGVLSNEEIRWLLRRAEGGFGIVTTAAAHVDEGGQGWEGEMGVWGDHQLPRLTELAEGLRARGSLSLVQIFHGGLRAPRAITGQQPVSASDVDDQGAEEPARALSGPEVEGLVTAFVEAAVRCERAGFDGVEVHGAHGYLIAQFLGTKTNRRTDRWGGDLAGRAAFLKAIVDGVRAATSPDFLLAVRLSPQIDAMGIRLEESLELATWLPAWGVDLLHISCWDAFQGAPDEPDDPRTLTRRFRAALPAGYPLLSTGAIWDAADAAFVLGEGADMVGVARVAIGHPDWPHGLTDAGYAPARPPFSPEALAAADLSPVFIAYMRRWKGFVTDGRDAD